MSAGALVLPADLTQYQAGDPQALIDQATAEVRRYCGWHIAPALTEPVTVDGSGGLFLSLPSLHVTNVTAVTEDGLLRDPSTYEWSEQGQLWAAYPWSGHFRGVTVDMTHGFSDVPEDVRAIVMAVASRAQLSPDGVVRRQVGAVSESYSQTGFNVAGGVSLMPHEKADLDSYRIRPRP